MNRWVVVGGGSWGTAFAVLLRDRGHEVSLACRDPEQAATIAETGHNLRYAARADLRGITATTIDAAPVAAADVVVVAVPSRAFAGVVSALPGSARACMPPGQSWTPCSLKKQGWGARY